MTNYAYFNGEFGRFDEVKIPLSDRSIYFGDGCYDVLLVRGGRVYQFAEHYGRLVGNCAALKIPFSFDARRMLSIIHRLCDLSCLSDAVVYIQVSRNGGKRQHEFDGGCVANLLVTVGDFMLCEPSVLSAITVEDRRHHICNIKTVNLLCSVLALREANEAGCECAIFLHDGIVTEESRSNVFIFKNGRLVTHATDNKILPGIMRSNVISLARQIGIPVDEREFGIDELYGADEVFVSSTTKFLRRVGRIDGVCRGMMRNDIFEMLYGGLMDDFLQKTE